MKQLELFKPYELDQNKSYEKFMWTKNGAQTIYWPTQQEWDEMCEQSSHDTQQDQRGLFSFNTFQPLYKSTCFEPLDASAFFTA